MKYKVIEKFADINTGQIYEVGSEIEFTDKRAKEIKKAGSFIEAIEEPKAEEVEEVKEEKAEETEEKPKAKSTKKKSAKK